MDTKEDYVIVIEPTDPIYIPVGTYTVMVKAEDNGYGESEGIFQLSYNK